MHAQASISSGRSSKLLQRNFFTGALAPRRLPAVDDGSSPKAPATSPNQAKPGTPDHNQG
jgi:hypothetical protein